MFLINQLGVEQHSYGRRLSSPTSDYLSRRIGRNPFYNIHFNLD